MTVSVIDERNLKFIVDVITEIKKDTKGNVNGKYLSIINGK